MTPRTVARLAAVALTTGTLALAPVQAFAASTDAAQPLPAPTSFVVLQGGTGTDKAVAAVRAAGGTVVQEWPQIGVVIAESSDGTFDDRAAREPGIVSAGPTRALAGFAKPTGIVPDGVVQGLGPGTAGGDDTKEPLNANQWDMRLMKADKAHQITDGNRAIVVGVLDSGVEADHPDLAANVDASLSVGCAGRGVPDPSPSAWQPTTSSHGTHVAGTIAAARNGMGIVGVAPNVRLASIKVVDDDGFIYPEYAICGFVSAADKGIQVTNNSYFIDPYYLWCKADPEQRPVIDAVNRALKYSEHKNVVNVAAAGNSNWDLSKPIPDEGSPDNAEVPEVRWTNHKCYDLPSEAQNTVVVSSIGPTAQKSYYSNYGRGVITVTAPGGDSRVPADTPSKNGRILSTVLDGKWGYSQGTSMASPHVAGVVALLRGADMGLNAKQTIATLKRQADQMPCPQTGQDSDRDGVIDTFCEGKQLGTGWYGAGLADALDAVR